MLSEAQRAQRRAAGQALKAKVHPDYFRFIGRIGGHRSQYRTLIAMGVDQDDPHYQELLARHNCEAGTQIMLQLFEPGSDRGKFRYLDGKRHGRGPRGKYGKRQKQAAATAATAPALIAMVLLLLLSLISTTTTTARAEARSQPLDGLPPQTQVDESPEFDSMLVIYVDPTYKLETWSDAVSFAPDARCSRAASDGQTWGHFQVTLSLWSKDGSGDANYSDRYTTGCMPVTPIDNFGVGWYAVAPSYFGSSKN